MSTKKTDKIVHISWIDSMGTPGWRSDTSDTDLRCESVGFLIEKKEDRVKIYMNKSAYQQGDIMEIPMSAVKKIRFLK